MRVVIGSVLLVSSLSGLLMGVSGCSTTAPIASTPPIAPIIIDDNRSREQLHALLWLQTAPEYRAAAEQTYRAATAQLQSLLNSSTSAEVEQANAAGLTSKPPAIVMDLDETVLDNSAYNAMLVQQHQAYNASNWLAWVVAQQATAVPGAVQFITAARELGYRVLFVSNRACAGRTSYDQNGEAMDCPQQAATLGNLAKVLGYAPTANELLLRSETAPWRRSDKTARRLAVAADYRVAMLVGDNLEDFITIAAYDAKRHGAHWGRDWFVLPNPVYGSWTETSTNVAIKGATNGPTNREMNVQEKCLALKAWDGGEPAGAVCYAAPP